MSSRTTRISYFISFFLASAGGMSSLVCPWGASSFSAAPMVVSAFSPPSTAFRSQSSLNAHHPALEPSTEDDDPGNGTTSRGWSRRDVLDSTRSLAAVSAGTLWLGSGEAARAAAAGPVVVVGASGRTGSLCVNACLRRGIPAKALTRTGEWTSPPTPPGAVTTYTGDTSKLLTIAQCDVTKLDVDALASIFKGCSAVIYAASASKKGGTAQAVDNVGVANVASASVAANVPRCVVISSTATTRPKSLGYVFTNLGVGGNIMGEKRNGELGTMAAYKSSSSSSYTIIRPGGLEEPKRNSVLGPSTLELSQGDVFSGIISRADVAEITVELALSTAANLKNTAVELYYTDSVVEVEGKFKPLLAAAKQEGSPENKLLRLHGNTYSQLLQGIRPGIDFSTE